MWQPDRFKTLLRSFGLQQHINEPTHCSGHCLDLIITRDDLLLSDVKIHPGLSDHFAIFCKFDLKRPTTHKTVRKSRNLKQIDIEKFTNDIKACVSNITDVSVILEDSVESYSDLRAVLDLHAPVQNKTKQLGKRKLNRGIPMKFDLKGKSIRFSQFEPASDEEILKIVKNSPSKSCALDPVPTSLIKKCTSAFIPLITHIVNKSLENVCEVVSATTNEPAIIAEELNTYFTNVANNITSNLQFTDVDPCSFLKQCSSFHNVSTDFVLKEISELNSAKSAGHDGIDGKLVRTAAPIIANFLTQIINTSISSQSFPLSWKIGKVTPIFKSGNKHLPDNYRPISVLPIMSKVIEKAVGMQVLEYLSSNNLLCPNQSGFRPTYSTITAITKTHDSWIHSINEDGFNLYRRDRQEDKRGGGVLLLINNKYRSCRLIKFEDESQELIPVNNDLDVPNLPEYPIDCLSKLEFNQEVIEKHINGIDSHKASVRGMDDGKLTALVLLDLSAAFDTVDHSVLLNRLSTYIGIEGNALMIGVGHIWKNDLNTYVLVMLFQKLLF
ncbi:uncharacterized protein [Antedon mediterranea]|uniref:uncharacterized protein n=1 Tax=Antedon mediterranea TaxID=105859 RepID=UPI003AF668D7